MMDLSTKNLSNPPLKLPKPVNITTYSGRKFHILIISCVEEVSPSTSHQLHRVPLNCSVLGGGEKVISDHFLCPKHTSDYSIAKEAFGQAIKIAIRNPSADSTAMNNLSISDSEGNMPGSAEKAAVRWQLQADNTVDALESLTKSVVNKDVMVPIGL